MEYINNNHGLIAINHNYHLQYQI